MGRRKKTWEKWLEDFKKVHGDRYEYPVDQVLDKGSATKVKITCDVHEEFEQSIDSHKRGNGCPDCSGQKKTWEEWVADCKRVHGDRYEYPADQVLDKGYDTRVKITCDVHGEFEQSIYAHKRGRGCPDCGKESKTKDKQHFLDTSIKVHGTKYDYSKVVYSTVRTKVNIVCEYHGDFWQRPGDHYRGNGCPDCWNQKNGDTRRSTTDDFVARSHEVHGEKYDYRSVKYSSATDKVEIICPLHRSFWQTPNNHMSGKGCPDCAIESSGWGQAGYYGTDLPSNIYVLKLNDSSIKVGLATDVSRRMNAINRESGYYVEKLYSVSGKAYELFKLEQKILRRSGLNRYYPEVSFAGQSECLEMSELHKVLESIKEFEDSLDSTPELYETEPTQTE